LGAATCCSAASYPAQAAHQQQATQPKQQPDAQQHAIQPKQPTEQQNVWAIDIDIMFQRLQLLGEEIIILQGTRMQFHETYGQG